MTTRKPDPDKRPRPTPPVPEKRATKPSQAQPSQADQAHIATAGYWREQQAAVDRIAKLKARRLAQADKTEPPKAKPKPKKQKTPSMPDRPKTSRRSRRWGT